jgi:hypothetical protein
VFGELTLGNSEFAKHEIWSFHFSNEISTYDAIGALRNDENVSE